MINLRPVVEIERATLAAALADYLGEVAPQSTIDPAGIAARYLDQPERSAEWIIDGSDIIGFALHFSHNDGTRELGEFTVFPAARRNGLGCVAAGALFARCPGRWQLGVSKASPAAAAFWRACLGRLPSVGGLIEAPPLTPQQSCSYSFLAEGAAR